MSDSNEQLVGFAYGEDLEGVSRRSLGYRLLAPLEPQPWSAEVEALARRLQAAPYSDHWPPTDLFCSVLLADGQRLIAVARYGLADHTPSQRRGGLELIGVVGPAGLDVGSALAVYRWLGQRRAAADDLHALGGRFELADVQKAAPPPSRPSDPLPVLPIRLWQEGALLFAAGTPSEPDHRLRLLEMGAGSSWQWLPLVGSDFPLQTYAQRGPLVAWTPHLAGVALKLEHKPAEAPKPPSGRRSRLPWAVAILFLLVLAGLLAANLWSLLDLRQRLASSSSNNLAAPGKEPVAPAPAPTGPTVVGQGEGARDRFADALYDLLIEQGGRREWEEAKGMLLTRYERLARDHKNLRVREDDVKAKVLVAAVGVLAGRGADRIEENVRKALENGFSKKLIDAAAEQVREKLLAEIKERP
jgi:hypothetical protein